MTWTLKAIELPDGRWTCRFGSADLGTYRSLVVALHHLAEFATELGGRANFWFHLHHLDGRIVTRPASDPVPGEAE
jgi:hypothetical protein